MWDRLKIVPQSSGRHAGQPLDDGRIRVGLGIGYGGRNAPKGYSYSIKGGPAPPRPPREFFESQYETVSAAKEPPRRNPNRITVRTANFRPTSSVYSQDSLPYVASYTANVATKYSYRYGGADEISPPSSPEPDAAHVDRFLPGDVSPIDEDDGPEYHHTGISNSDRSGQPPASEPRTRPQSPPRNRGAASIPAMRRERRRQSDAAARGARPQQAGPTPQQTGNLPARDVPRWDPLTGEQTSSSQGRTAQVKPAEYAQGLGITPQTWTEPRQSPTAPPPSFGDRVRRIAKKAAAAREGITDPAAGAFTSSRPGWRGASGRTAIVEPVHDTRDVAPLRVPEKSNRRNIPAAIGLRSKNNTPDGPARRGQTPPISPPASETPTRSTPRYAIKRVLPTSQPLAATQTQSQASQRYPSPPLSDNPARADAPAVTAARELVRDGHDAAHSSTPLHSPDSSNQFRRKPPPVHTTPHHHHQHQVSVSSVYSQQTDFAQSSLPPATDNSRPAAASEEPYVPPPSRFSITTYATSNTGTTREDLDEHAGEDQPPVPSLPADYQQHYAGGDGRPSSDHSPVTSPVDQFMTSPFSEPQAITPRNQPPADLDQQQQHSPQAAASMSSPPHANPALARALALDRPSSRASDINKTLPPAPPEQSADQAHDRVGLLNAQLRSLANRRININRSIQQMTELMPTDKLMNSAEVVRKREDEKRKVEALRQELADVQREEYELGLKLHRAYKRQDREAEWEPTTLWVRRVTG